MGIWTGYEQFCIVGTDTTPRIITNPTSARRLMTTPKYLDYSNYALSISNNDTGITLTPLNSSQFSIIFWFFLENNTNANIISLKENSGSIPFKLAVQQSRLVIYHILKKQTKSTATTLLNISVEKWEHFTWIIQIKIINQIYILMVHVNNPSISKASITTLILFDRLFNGLTTRVEIWKQIISEQQLLGSYHDCRKQNGDIFSWSQVSNQISIDANKLESSSFNLYEWS